MPKVLNMSKLHANITYQHRREPDDLFFTFFNTASMHDNTTTQTIHYSYCMDKTQIEQDNKDEDNEECDLPYISEAEFELDDIIHPAIDENSKWELFGLFCSLELPFH
ncbi:hypothetical protein F8M41_015408 [Gigaspora margarita]|uniref:Uncharacterized protein n=1 Tax=Gigaspora margarita TaxID=4874 RepID=A0A8H3ZWE5_GIGMA|nr:hypothetical protein F8M41_015408 [Gigaspora margarita]